MSTRPRFRLVAAIAGAALTLGTAAAMAKSGDRERADGAAEISAILGAHTSPADAIKAAEAKTGGRAVGFEAEDHDGALAYRVRVAQADGLRHVTVDPATGVATVAPAGTGHRTEAAAMPFASVPLAAAITTAEQKAGGRAIAARGTTANDQPAYEVQVAHADVVDRVTVSAADGRVLLVARADESQDSDHRGDVD